VPVAKKTIHHMDLATLVQVNKDVVALTGEPHEYSAADGEKLAALISEVEARANNQDFEEAVPEKAALLVFKIASGQYFRAGNKRTALVAGVTFLVKNGYSMDIRNSDFVSTVDRAGVAAASLDDLFEVLSGLVRKTPTERKGWENAIRQVIDSNRAFLVRLSS